MRLNSLGLQIKGRTAIGSKDCPKILDQMPPFGGIKVVSKSDQLGSEAGSLSLAAPHACSDTFVSVET